MPGGRQDRLPVRASGIAAECDSPLPSSVPAWRRSQHDLHAAHVSSAPRKPVREPVRELTGTPASSLPGIFTPPFTVRVTLGLCAELARAGLIEPARRRRGDPTAN